MVHPRLNQIFARMNERTGLNEDWMKFLLLSFASSDHCFFTHHISAIMNEMTNFKLPKFLFKAVSNSNTLWGKPYYDASNYLYDTGIDFTERWHFLFTRVTESLLCSAWVPFLCNCEGYLVESQCFQRFDSQTLIRVTLLAEVQK